MGTGGAVFLYGDAEDCVGEGLCHVEVVAVRGEGQAVGEVYRFVVPELARAVGVKAEDARSRLLESVAVADVEVVVGVEGHPVGEAGRGGGLFYRASVGLDAVDLSALSPTPHAPIPTHGEPLRVV